MHIVKGPLHLLIYTATSKKGQDRFVYIFTAQICKVDKKQRETSNNDINSKKDFPSSTFILTGQFHTGQIFRQPTINTSIFIVGASMRGDAS